MSAAEDAPLVLEVLELANLVLGGDAALVDLVLELSPLLRERSGNVRALDALHKGGALLVGLGERRQRVVGVAHRLLRALPLLLPTPPSPRPTLTSGAKSSEHSDECDEHEPSSSDDRACPCPPCW